MHQISGMIPKVGLCFVEKLVEYLAGPNCGEDAGGHMLDEDFSAGVAELAPGQQVCGDAFLA